MIQRKASKIVDSLVNSTHEDHFNVSKAIRDDAPITNLTTVVKSVNFEADGDGAYILRKPLVAKETSTNRRRYIYDHETLLILSPTTLLVLNKATSITLKCYDSELEKHEITFNTNVVQIPWLSVDSTLLENGKYFYNCSDHTLLNVIINHRTFLNTYVSSQPYHITWSLVPIQIQSATTYKTTTYLKRFLSIYESETPGHFIIEIINPEPNSITSGLDVGNAETLDFNLLLDNPYSIRDLYNYGYFSTTKILPYVVKADDSAIDAFSIGRHTLTELTETDFNDMTETNPLDSAFRMLVSGPINNTNFPKRYLILKAFITTAITSGIYYCCWERSRDDGITWEECPEFVNNDAFTIVPILVSDLTSSDFDNMVYEESLEKAASYLVTKNVVKFNNTIQYNQHDYMYARPDVLIIDTQSTDVNASKPFYKFRFSIYLNTNKETPTPKATTYTITKTSFDDASSGSFDEDDYITYSTAQNDADNAPSLDGTKLKLEVGPATYQIGTPMSQRFAGLGNSLTIQCNNDSYKLKNVVINVAPKTLVPDTTTYTNLGATIGAVGTTQLPLLNDAENNPYNLANIYLGVPSGGLAFYEYDARNLFVAESSVKKFVASSYDPESKIISFVNLSRCFTDSNNTPTGINSYTDCNLVISSISVTYTVDSPVQTTSTYLVSMTGAFSLPYSTELELVTDLTSERNRLFSGNMYYNENQAQLLVYKDNYVYASGTNSAIMKLLNSLSLPEKVTKIIPWRGYLLLFSPRNIYLAKYNIDSDGYSTKVLSNTIGVSDVDADTIVPILNSVYFKSGTKIYKLVPNLYASSDDILNIHQISVGINTILEDIVTNYTESNNFSYSDADKYSLFIPISALNKTFCVTYEFTKQLWTLLEYPRTLLGIEKLSNTEVYLRSASYLYYFKESLTYLLTKGLQEWCTENSESVADYNIQTFIHSIPYADYLSYTPKNLVNLILNSPSTNNSFEDTFAGKMTPINFEIDFGQKSSNYTMDKQFLESKLILATLTSKDSFPLTLDIYTDGVSRELHWDINTDGALWKNSLDDVGVLNTSFSPEGADYNGIFRQLIVKYSGRGKSIRHVISGTSKSLFKFYSMDVRARILPKKH